MNRASACKACLRCLSAAAVLTVIGGCAVGPDFKRPEAPKAAGYTPAPLPATTASVAGIAGAAQDFSTERDIPAEWWTLFQSPALDALIKRAFAASPTIASAQAALAEAQENVYAQQGLFYPTVQASYSPSRTKIAGNLGGNSPGVQGNGSVISTVQNTPAAQGGTAPFNAPVIYNFHTAQLTVGFVPDIFGANRRQVESLQAQADAQHFQLEATYITLASNVVAAAIQEASVKAQIAALKQIIDSNTRSLDILRRQLQSGYAGQLDVAAQESALAQSEEQLPALEKQLAQTQDLIRVLAGNTPDQDVSESFELESFQLPQELPLSLPSRLVEQRPDVRAAEEQLHAACAEVGVAEADRLPQFSINATAGGEASQFSQMFWDSGKFFSVIGSISQTLFDGGTLKHKQRAAEQALIQADAQYRSTALTAFQNVADTLHAIYADADTLKAATVAEQAARHTLDITRRQQHAGYAGYLALLTAEQNYQQAEMALVQAEAGRLGDTAALFQAHGGGWWNSGDQPKD